jgi:hypothetical protein
VFNGLWRIAMSLKILFVVMRRFFEFVSVDCVFVSLLVGCGCGFVATNQGRGFV